MRVKGMDEKDATQKIIRFLKEGLFPFAPPFIQGAAENLGIGGNLEELTRRIQAEGARETMRAIEKFFEALDTPHLDLSSIEAHLRGGGEVEISPKLRGGKWGVDVDVRGPHKNLVGSWHYPLPAVASLAGLELCARAGLVMLGNNYDLDIVGDRAFFKTEDGERLTGITKALSGLKPFLSAIGHEGLPEALEGLENLEKGESRLEGRYVLAHGKGFWALKDWPIMGDPALDGAILLGRDVSLDFPGEVGVSFKVVWRKRSMISTLAYVRFRLGEESFHIDWPRSWRSVSGTAPEKDFVTTLIQDALAEELEDAERMGRRHPEPPSAKMLAFLRAFMEHQAPFQALANGSLSPYVVAELFRDL